MNRTAEVNSLKALTSGKYRTSSTPGFLQVLSQNLCFFVACFSIFFSAQLCHTRNLFFNAKSHIRRKKNPGLLIGCQTDPFSSSTIRSDPMVFMFLGFTRCLCPTVTIQVPALHTQGIPQTTTLPPLGDQPAVLKRSCCETEALKSRCTG